MVHGAALPGLQQLHAVGAGLLHALAVLEEQIVFLFVGAGKGHAQHQHRQARMQAYGAHGTPAALARQGGQAGQQPGQTGHGARRGQQGHGLAVTQEEEGRARGHEGPQSQPAARRVTQAAVPAQPGADHEQQHDQHAQGHADTVVEIGVQAVGLRRPEQADDRPHGAHEDDDRKGQQQPADHHQKTFAADDARQLAPARGHGKGRPEGDQQAPQHEDRQGRAHAAVAEGMHGLHHAAAHQIGGEKGGDGGQAHQGHVHAVQLVAALLHDEGVQGRRADEPGDEGGVLHRVPGPVAAPAQFHVGPPHAQDDARGQKGPGQQGHGTGHAVPAVLALTAGKALGQGQTGGHGEAAVAQEEQRRMEDHAGVLQQGVEAVAVRRHGRLHLERIAPAGKDQGEEGHDGVEEAPVPEPRGGRQAPVGGRQGKDAAADGHGEGPEQHGARLSGPEGRQAVEGGQHTVRVAGHIDQAEVVPEQGVQQQGRRQGQGAGDGPVDLFDERQGVAALLPELQERQRAAAQSTDQGQQLHGIGNEIHGAPLGTPRPAVAAHFR